METQTLHDVPADDVEQIVTDFESEGYTVTKQKQTNGNYTIVATRKRSRNDAAPTKATTVVLHNVKKSELSEVVGDLASEGYAITVQPEDDGEFTVIGTKK